MRVWLVAAMFVGWAVNVPAAPLDLKQVGADVKWLVHVDVDAMRQSAVVGKVAEEARERIQQRAAPLVQVFEQLKFDPRKDLHGITLYGATIGKREAVVLLDGVFDAEHLQQKASQAPGYQTSKHGDRTLHAFTARTQRNVVAAFYRPTLVVLAPTEAELTAALDVLDGKSPRLAGKDSPLAAEAPAGAIAVVRAIKPADAELPFKSPLIQQGDWVAVAAGEHEGQAFAEGNVAARSAEVAQQFKGVMEGVRAMIELHHGEDPDVQRALKGLKVDVTENRVNFSVRLSVDDTLAVARKAAQAARAARAKVEGRKAERLEK